MKGTIGDCFTGSEFELRRLVPADAAAAVELRREMLTLEPFAFLRSPEDDGGLDVDVVRERLGSADNAVFGAFDGDGALVAQSAVVRDEPVKVRHRVWIVAVYTQPSARRRGLSRRLIELCLEHARGLGGIELVHLSTGATNEAALALYRSLGFVEWGTEPRALKIDGRYADETHMVLDYGMSDSSRLRQ